MAYFNLIKCLMMMSWFRTEHNIDRTMRNICQSNVVHYYFDLFSVKLTFDESSKCFRFINRSINIPPKWRTHTHKILFSSIIASILSHQAFCLQNCLCLYCKCASLSPPFPFHFVKKEYYEHLFLSFLNRT